MKSGALPGLLFLVLLILTDWHIDWRLTSTLYWSVVGLDGSNTAEDYLSASLEKERRFEITMCNDGVCLAKLDWRCGFTINSSNFEHEEYGDWYEAVDDCFGTLVRVVPLYTPLDKVRKICGRHYMQFDPHQGETREQCEAKGGEWGVKKMLWSDEEALLEKAGIED